MDQQMKILECFSIPHRRVRQFIGREDVVTKISEGFSVAATTLESRCVVLRSLGGQGKSQVALEYCQRTRGKPYGSILWIDASSENSIKRDFALFYERSKHQVD